MKEVVIISVLIGVCFGMNAGFNYVLSKQHYDPNLPTAEEMRGVKERMDQRIDTLFERITHDS